MGGGGGVINTNNWPILTYMKNRMHNSGCGRCEMKQPQLITWNNSGKCILSILQILHFVMRERFSRNVCSCECPVVLREAYT